MYFLSKLSSSLCFLSLISSCYAWQHDNDYIKTIEDYEARRPVITKMTVGFTDQAIDLIENTPVELINKHYHNFGHNKIIEHAETKEITVVTDCSVNHFVQLETKRVCVSEGDIMIAPYKIVVYPGGVITLGFLNTARIGFHALHRYLREGTHEGVYWAEIPAGETETSLTFHNYTDNGTSSVFTIEYIGLYKQRK